MAQKVTVGKVLERTIKDKKESKIKKSLYAGSEELVAVDLPGAYSMSPFTSEESITSSYVKHENPDAIINIVDATNKPNAIPTTRNGCAN